MAIKFASASALVGWQGEHVSLVLDEPWHADDPFVLARPDLFKDEPTNVCRTSGYAPFVEEEPAAPVVEELPPTNTRRRAR